MFHAIGYPGYALTGSDLVAALERVTGRKLSVRGVPWLFMRLGALVSPMLREVVEMRYLWNEAHEIDGARFRAALPAFEATPLDAALTDAIGLARPA